MKRLNLISLLSLLMVGMFTFTSCDDDPTCEDFCTNGTCVNGECVPDDDDTDDGTVIINRNVESDETWTSDKIYQLATRVTVTNGATLTIEPGTIIKGEAGGGANATALLISQGSQLIAEGTADNPIIMTSVADEIESGQIASPNLDPTGPTYQGQWGGLIVLGRAPISANSQPTQIEGIPSSDPNGLYGGDVPDDNSGVIRYVSIRHGGANIGEGNEINGITLGGVGTGTVIENIEVVANQDDGIEWFGGTVNVSNVLIWNAGDDAFDADQAWTGTCDNFIGIMGSNSDHAMELDGPEGSRTGGYTLRNGSLKGWHEDGTGGGEYADLRDGCETSLENLYFFNFSDNADFEMDDENTSMNYTNGEVSFSNLEFNVSHLSSGNTTIEQIFKDQSGLDAFEGNAPDASVLTSPTVGASKSPFANWSWADAAGQLSDFQ